MLFRKIYSKVKILIIVVFSIVVCSCCFDFKVKASSQNELTKNVFELSIEELTNQIIDHELNYIYYFSDIIIGIEKFKSNNKYYIELSNREGVYNYMNNMCESCTLDNFNKLLLLDILDGDYYKYFIHYSEIINRNNIYAPNGTPIQFAYYGINQISQSEADDYHNDVVYVFPTLENSCISPANDAYNCHSYAWYMQNGLTNHYWIEYPNSYLLDESYIEVADEVRAGDILCYYAFGLNYSQGYLDYSEYISHSAIIVSEDGFDVGDSDTLVNVNLVSKWGVYGVYAHNGDECPY